MDPKVIQDFWNEAREQLLSWRADQTNENPPTVETLKASLVTGAQRIDTNRRTSLYNIPSPNEEACNKIIGDTTFVASKWLKDGRPSVPTV